MPLPDSLCSTLFAAVYKRTTEGEQKVSWLLAFALGYGAFAFCFGLFDVGGFWKGKELLKGK
jgi:dipeptide/tripeptide permease